MNALILVHVSLLGNCLSALCWGNVCLFCVGEMSVCSVLGKCLCALCWGNVCVLCAGEMSVCFCCECLYHWAVLSLCACLCGKGKFPAGRKTKQCYPSLTCTCMHTCVRACTHIHTRTHARTHARARARVQAHFLDTQIDTHTHKHA